MKLKLFQVDAFTDHVFGGNPAAVCPLVEWIADDLMQKIAMENNQAETAFFVKRENFFEVRWFTPLVEVDLCGHATLAAAHVIFEFEKFQGSIITFNSPRSGLLKVHKVDDTLTLDFPADQVKKVPISEELIRAFSKRPLQAYKGKTDYMLVYADESDVQDAIPDLQNISSQRDCRGIIITAPGKTCDFVSRFFAPQSGINEDPVTGSAHTTLAPYWGSVLKKSTLTAIQLSARKGFLTCEVANDRILISGKAKTYLIGEIIV